MGRKSLTNAAVKDLLIKNLVEIFKGKLVLLLTIRNLIMAQNQNSDKKKDPKQDQKKSTTGGKTGSQDRKQDPKKSK